jgi:hypothetical protein
MRLSPCSPKRLLSALAALLAVCGAAAAEPARAREAFYLLQSGSEGEEMTVTQMLLRVTGGGTAGGRPGVWWEFTAFTRSGGAYGVRMLSERAPMTGPDGIGEVERYLYRDANGKVFEYRDTATGRALLPRVSFHEHFLPVPAADARTDEGFATAGTYLGHTLILATPAARPAPVSFENPKRLDLRSDLLIATQVSGRYDTVPLKPGDPLPKERPYTKQELEDLIDAGMNQFNDVGEHQAWLIEQPVFYNSAPSFPDTFYRGNFYATRMFIDEPAVRFGWDAGMPARNLRGPEQFAAALRQRVWSQTRPQERKLAAGYAARLLELARPATNSWDTYQYSAWTQLQAGAAALIHEGRYRDRGYGWHPDAWFGEEGIDGLAFRDQMNYFNAFLRGAARAWNGDWGVSVYPEGLPRLFPDAFTQSYDMGARYLWFWTHPPVVGYATHLEVCRALKEHMKKHPRGGLREANRQGKVAIVLPAGWTIDSAGSIWGFEPDQVTRGGATYGDVALAATWEGILCSRRGVPFDFQQDAPLVADLGYERLVYVGPDAVLDARPPWTEDRAAKELRLSVEPDQGPPVAARAAGKKAEHRIPRAAAIQVDGRHDDWKGGWIALGAEAAGSDLIELDIEVPNVTSDKAWSEHRQTYLGIDFAQMDKKLQKQFDMGDYHIIGPDVVDETKPGISLEQGAVIVTTVRDGSPCAKAGLRPGDIIRKINGRETEWHFVVWGIMEKGAKGAPASFTFSITRNEKKRIGYAGDLAAKIALAADDAFLYAAVDVTDDVHSQPFDGWYYWQGDCVQIGLAPTLSGTEGGYSGQDHELAFVWRDDGKAAVWRYQGRRGRPRQEIDSATIAARRDGGRTLYEAAIPLGELQPLAPDLWPVIACNVVINDHDGAGEGRRKGRLELREGAMTRYKDTSKFALFGFDPSAGAQKISAAVLWRRRATPAGGFFRAVLAARSPKAGPGRVRASLQSLDAPQSPPVEASLALDVTPEPREWSLKLDTDSPPGRYALTIRVEDAQGRVAVADRLPVFVYPQ